jgi:hypothetical protein
MKFTPLGKIAWQETKVPIHPGNPHKQPFWNEFAQRFIFTPSFDFNENENASIYKFTLTSNTGSQSYSFITDKPWKPLTPIWTKLPFGNFHLKVEALNSKNEILAISGERDFLKSTPFNGPYFNTANNYRESGTRCLEDLFHQDKFQTWLESGEPNKDYPLWVHPTKIIGAVVRGMALYSKLTGQSSQAEQAIKIAKTAADFLFALREKEGQPLEFWPPTYWNGVPRGNHPIYVNQIMTHYPSEGARAFLDLFDISKEEKYFSAAIQIAKTYKKLQLENGTWPQLFNIHTAEEATPHLLIPTAVILFLDRLIEDYNQTQFQEMRDKAFKWCLENPIKTYDWHGQFEDTRPKQPYKNMSRAESVEMAILLFKESKKTPEYLELAKECLRFAEDGFVVWDKNDPVLQKDWFKPGSSWNGNDSETLKDWFLPCVMEQYAFFTPINASSSFVIIGFLEAYKTTGEKIYHAKAVSLANALTIAQQYHGGGEIPTHLRRTLPEKNWINCSVNTATTLINYSDLLAEKVDY